MPSVSLTFFYATSECFRISYCGTVEATKFGSSNDIWVLHGICSAQQAGEKPSTFDVFAV